MSNSPTVEIAPHAGFCFGVRRAAQALENAVQNLPEGGAVCTLGSLIHNETYIRSLEARGIFALEDAEAQKRAGEANADHPLTLIIRAHGIPLEIEKSLPEIAAQNPHFTLVDCTCPFVKKIQKIAEDCNPEKEFFVLLGNENHPEVKGVMSRAKGEKYVYDSSEELESVLRARNEQKNDGKTPYCMVPILRSIALMVLYLKK